MKFWLLWGFDALVALGFVFFFLVGLADGSVSSFNIRLWIVILSVLGTILGGAIWMKSSGRWLLGTCLLSVLALPTFLCALFFIIMVLSHPRWN